MAFDVTSAINALQDMWLGITGIRFAPDTPPDALGAFPFVVTYERSGELNPSEMHSGNFAPQKGQIWSDLHMARKDLPRDIAKVMTFRNLFLDALRDDPNLSGYVMMCTRVSWTLTPMVYNGVDTIGYRFVLEFDTEL